MFLLHVIIYSLELISLSSCPRVGYSALKNITIIVVVVVVEVVVVVSSISTSIIIQ